MKSLMIVLVLALVGCAGKETKKPDPVVVRVPEVQVVTKLVKEYVTLPGELLQPCYNEKAKQQTALEAKRLSILRDLSIIECNKRLDKARDLNGKHK